MEDGYEVVKGEKRVWRRNLRYTLEKMKWK